MGIDKDLLYRQGLMVLTSPMVLTQTHGIVSVLLNHTCTRGPSVTPMLDFFYGKSIAPPSGDIHRRPQPRWASGRQDQDI